MENVQHDKKIFSKERISQKTFFWGAVAAAIVCVIFGGILLAGFREKLPDELVPGKGVSELDGVSLSFCSADLSSGDPGITVAWQNQSGKTILFGDDFSLSYQDGEEWKDCCFSQDVVWESIGYTAEDGQTVKKRYPLWDFDLSRAGNYRFTSSFLVKEDHSSGDEEQQYEIRLEFELTEENLFSSLQMDIEEEVYCCQIDSPWGTSNAQDYRLINGSRFLILPPYETVWVDGGIAEKITLRESNFDSYFYDENQWADGYSLKSLREENKNAWQILPKDMQNVKFYFLLEQNDGSYFLTSGFVTDPALDSSGSMIRWVYRMSLTEEN